MAAAIITCILCVQVVKIIPEPYGPEGLLAASGDEWRDKRHSLTPAFSAAKMKMVDVHNARFVIDSYHY